MALWLIPALKAIAPHLGTIIAVAAPVFTKKNSDAEVNQAVLVQQQITELQSAVSRNAENTRELAEQLQGTVKALEQAALLAQGRMQRTVRLAVLAGLLSLAALAMALVVLFSA